MSLIKSFVISNIGRKSLVGLSGLGLALFVLIHMLGNLLFFRGPEVFNLYAYELHEFLLIEILEIGLICTFLLHLVLTVLLIINNRKARVKSYAKSAQFKKPDWAFKSLFIQAGILLIFIIQHLKNFKFGPNYIFEVEGLQIRDVYRLVEESFADPRILFFYSLSLFLLFLHLGRGLLASLRSLGLFSEKWESVLKNFSWSFSLLVFFGFLSVPFYVYFMM